jgi:hypothetical protein
LGFDGFAARMLARSVYLPPAEPWVIETCFNEVMGWAPVIVDPIEQASFVFVHLLYLQPFAMLNASMACLAVNIPLLRDVFIAAYNDCRARYGRV